MGDGDVSEVPARSGAIAEDVWRYFTTQVIDDMLASGENCTDTGLYLRRRDEALTVLEQKLARELRRGKPAKETAK